MHAEDPDVDLSASLGDLLDAEGPVYDPSVLPDELRDVDQSINTKLQWYSVNQSRKVPKNPHLVGKRGVNAKASVSDPETWANIDIALAAHETYYVQTDGIGFVFTDDDPWVFIDLDHVVNPRTRIVAEWAADFVKKFPGAYVEYSRSGTGLHIITRSDRMPLADKKSGGKWSLTDGQAIEIYWGRRYCWLTTRLFAGPCANPLPDHTAQVQELWESLPARKATTDRDWGEDEPTPGSLRSNEEIIAKAKGAANGLKFRLLWRGEWKAVVGDDSKPAYGSQSEADQALVGMLAFWTGPHAGKIDELFRLSGLYRQKWERDDYQASTIEGVLGSREPKDYYQWAQGVKEEEQGQEANEEGQERAAPPKHGTDITAYDLLSGDYGPAQMLIEEILPVGTHLLAGAPKSGKSFMALQVADAVARGTDFMGFSCEDPGAVLYLALEDNLHRLHRRYRHMLFGPPTEDDPPTLEDDAPLGSVFDFDNIIEPPENLTFRLANPTLAEGGLDAIRDWALKTEHPRLVIIDVLGRFRGDDEKRGQSAYKIDQTSISAIHDFASKHGLTVLLVHHTRKSAPNAKPGSGDALEKISGTLGIAGSVDNMWVLTRSRGEHMAQMFLSGREIENECTLALRFDPTTVRWESLGDADTLAASDQQQVVLDYLKQHGGVKASELAEWAEISPTSARQRLSRMWKAGLLNRANGRYTIAGAR